MPIYVCNVDQHNKYWQFETNGNSVEIKWGRIGGTSDSQIKEFSSTFERDKFISKKIAEKLAKGYKESNENELSQETDTARAIGAQNKISKILWVNRKGNRLSIIDNYDPTQWVYVEVLNSWSKNVSRFLLSKNESYSIYGSITEIDRAIEFDDAQRTNSSMISAIKNVLRRTAQKVIEVVKMAALGVRRLDGDDDDIDTGSSDILKSICSAENVSEQVISKFSTMGTRVLDL